VAPLRRTAGGRGAGACTPHGAPKFGATRRARKIRRGRAAGRAGGRLLPPSRRSVVAYCLQAPRSRRPFPAFGRAATACRRGAGGRRRAAAPTGSRISTINCEKRSPPFLFWVGCSLAGGAAGGDCWCMAAWEGGSGTRRLLPAPSPADGPPCGCVTGAPFVDDQSRGDRNRDTQPFADANVSCSEGDGDALRGCPDTTAASSTMVRCVQTVAGSPVPPCACRKETARLLGMGGA